MEEDILFETPITNFRRLIKQDHSETFRIFVKYYTSNNTENDFFIDTTVNKARVISHKIDESYQADPTIRQYQINIPKYFIKENIEQSLLQEILQFLISSVSHKVRIQKEKFPLFTIFQYLLGECDKVTLNEQKLLINTQEEAIQFLNTEFHELSIQYLSNHITRLIESDQAKTISKQSFNEIIDSYIHNINNETKKQEDTEKVDIFNKMQAANLDRKILMHYLIHIDFDYYNDEMIQYFNDNLDDEILLESLPRVKLIFKKQANSMKSKKKKEMKGKMKGKITECEFNGDERSGIIAFLNHFYGGDAVGSGKLALRDGIQSDQKKVKAILNPESCYRHNANSRDKAWIEFDFGRLKVNLSSYSICVCSENSGPKSWLISGSNDRSCWTVLSKMKNREETKGHCVQKKFDCNKNSGFYQFIRFTLLDTWYNVPQKKYKLHLKYIDFFGSMIDQ